MFAASALLLWAEATAEELPERHSTASRYRCWLKNHIEPKWRDFPTESIKPLLVEDWLKRLNLASKSKAHLKTLMDVLSNAAMRWELIPYQHNPMSLVRVKDSSKRLKGTKVPDGARILRPHRTHSRTLSDNVHFSDVLGIACKRSPWS